MFDQNYPAPPNAVYVKQSASLADMTFDYEQKVTKLWGELNTYKEQILRVELFNLLTLRDNIQAFLEANTACRGEEFSRLYEGDEKLFLLLVKVYDKNFKPELRLNDWRYVRRETPANYWWWFDPKKLRRDGDHFMILDTSPLRLVTVIILVIAFGSLLLTTLQLISDEQIIFAALNVVVQLALGGLLIVPFVYSIRFLGRLGALVSDFFTWSSRLFTKQGAEAPQLWAQRSVITPGVLPLIVAILFLIGTLALPRLLTSIANSLYDRAVQAVDGGVNLTAGEAYLDLVNRLNPGNRQAAAKLAQLALLYQNTGRMEKAAELYQRSLEYDGRVVLALDQLAEYYIDVGEYDRAIQLTNRAIGLLDTHLASTPEQRTLPLDEWEAVQWMYRTMVTRGRARLAMGLPENALTNDLEKALKMPADPEYGAYFIDPELTTGILRDPRAISTNEARFRRGVAFVMLASRPGCTEAHIEEAWKSFELLPKYTVAVSPDDSRAQTWQTAARRAGDELGDLTCESLMERDFSWLLQIN